MVELQQQSVEAGLLSGFFATSPAARSDGSGYAQAAAQVHEVCPLEVRHVLLIFGPSECFFLDSVQLAAATGSHQKIA